MVSVMSVFSCLLLAGVAASQGLGIPGIPGIPGLTGTASPTSSTNSEPQSTSDFEQPHGSSNKSLPPPIPTSPPYPWLFQYPLPIPQVAKPFFTEKVNGGLIEYYQMTVEAFEQTIYPNLGPAKFVGYNGTSPGPTFKLKKNVESVVRIINNASYSQAFHLHGSPTHSAWDGWAQDLVLPGQYKDYYYPNSQPGPLWYHDHVDGQTSDHVYFGGVGVYMVEDEGEDKLGLPEDEYDIALGIIDKIYKSDGQLWFNKHDNLNFYGDIIHVNGQPWPYFNVEPRRYRLRFYEMSLSRAYTLKFIDENGEAIEFQVIASEAGLFEHPVNSKDLQYSMGERYELVIDFSPYKGTNITLMNTLEDGAIASANTDKVMRFVIGDTVTSFKNNGPVPSKLKNVNWPAPKNTVDHVFEFQHGGDAAWTINGVSFNDVNNRVLARPPQGSVELWQLNYVSGPGIHPVHIHLVNFQVVSRTGGRKQVLPYEKAGLKDTVYLDPGETVKVRAVYGPWNGMYLFHCHNLIHEDTLMMDAFNTTLVKELGYEFNGTQDYGDPTDPRFTAREYNAAATPLASIKSVVSSLGALNAYRPAASLAAAETSYWKTATGPTDSATPAHHTGTWPTAASYYDFGFSTVPQQRRGVPATAVPVPTQR